LYVRYHTLNMHTHIPVPNTCNMLGISRRSVQSCADSGASKS
jgi:hypothetical protein